MTSSVTRAGWMALLGSVAALALSGCDGGSATAPARDHTADASASAPVAGSSARTADSGSTSSALSDREDHRHDPVAMVSGKPMWANSKKYSAEESADYHFKRDGASFDAKSVDDYVAKAHAFVNKPPKDALTLVRNNGDKLIYDPKRNIFAVVTKDGAPRTMFKPDQGQAYWDQQKQREADRAKGGDDYGGSRHYTRRSNRGSDDGSDG
jgi:pyocin large subunit-like protein